MSDKEIIAKRLQLLGKREEIKQSIDSKSKSNSSEVGKASKQKERSDSVKADESTNIEPYEPELLVDQFEIDTSHMAENRINTSQGPGQGYNTSHNNNSSLSYSDYAMIKYAGFKQFLSKIPRHYYDPFHNSETSVRLSFYCLCVSTIIILMLVIYGML